jgi:hypothetical protein
MIDAGLRDRMICEASLDRADAALAELVLTDIDYFMAMVDRLSEAELGGPFRPVSDFERSLLFSLAGHALNHGLIAACDRMGEREEQEPRSEVA